MRQYKDYYTNGVSIKELPQSERPRERLQEHGPLALSDLELLTLLIGSGTSRNPAMKVAEQLLYLLDKLSGEEEITIEQLTSIDGMGLAKATLVLAALELGRRRLPPKRKQIVFPSDVFPLIRHYASRPQECFLSISLNGAHEVISINVVSIGLVNHTLVHPREVFATPLRERATAVIIAHNHPSGILQPSGDDRNVTRRLVKAGELLGIKVLDHLIFSEEEYRSMLEKDEMD